FQDGKEFGIGELVWGKIKGFSWWPAIVVSHRVTAKRQAVSGMRWVQWFGDGKFSEVSLLPSPKHPSLHISAPLLRLASLSKGCITCQHMGLQTHRHLFCLFLLPLARKQNLGKSCGWAVPASVSTGAGGGQMGSLQGWRHQSVAKSTPRVGIYQLPLSRGHQGPHVCVCVCVCCPPTKRLKTYPCNNSKEQRVEEDQTREQMVSEVTNNSGKLEDSCLSCGRRNPAIFHPLFKGGLCQTCR
ncbi:DNM3B methyltransferase, partial [Pomatorhinus ruficollis]|nr:DNM3B methyltransferase [Pomatorhinus ruficollis]